LKDLIFGNHSIAAAINNPKRTNLNLFCTEDSKRDLEKLHFKGSRLPGVVNTNLLSLHKLKEEGKKYLKELSFSEQRIPSNIFLITDSLFTDGISKIYGRLEAGEKLRLMALDQVTDIHNLGAICRTANFYDLDALIIARKNKDSLSPGFFRAASGAYEYLPLVQTANISKVIRKLSDLNVECVGLAEEADADVKIEQSNSICVILGAEETGLSHATRRVIKKFVSFKPKGETKSLNVSIAAALAMEKFLD